MNDTRDTIRVDRWLWFARFFKTRGLAARLVSGGRVRVNSAKISKPAFAIAVGDTLTFPQVETIRVVRVMGLGIRRGPAPEAAMLYQDLTPVAEKPPPKAKRIPNRRPTKKERRAPGFPSREMLE